MSPSPIGSSWYTRPVAGARAKTLVLDAGPALRACGIEGGFDEFRGAKLAGPPLLWSEVRSALRLSVWQGRVSVPSAERTLERLEDGPMEKIDHRELGREAWRIATELGWGRTYDAEYVALASLLDCRLVTLDQKLRRGTDRLGFVVTPAEL